MKTIKRICFLLVAFMAVVSCSTARQVAADKDTLQWRYEVEPVAGQARQGHILVKVWSYSKDKNIAITQAGKNAVHGVLFKGVAALMDATNRLPAQKPIITEVGVEERNQDFFKTFFAEGGKYQKFIQFVNNGIPASGDILNVGKEYKIGVRVSVAKDALRKEMEADGIIGKLGSGF